LAIFDRDFDTLLPSENDVSRAVNEFVYNCSYPMVDPNIARRDGTLGADSQRPMDVRAEIRYALCSHPRSYHFLFQCIRDTMYDFS
jgi:hypothetical protein